MNNPSPNIISGKIFHKKREELAKKFYEYYNRVIFENKLPHDLKIIWNIKLNLTAGVTSFKNHEHSIQLATKVVDDTEKLSNTLVHEMCHVATSVINHLPENYGHGKFFKVIFIF